jgi:integrase
MIEQPIRQQKKNGDQQDDDAEQKKLSRPYINARCARIKRMFRWAASEELVPVSVYQALATVPGLQRGRTMAREPEPIGPVPEKDIEATLRRLPSVVRAMVQFQRFTGCRPGEVCMLRPCDVDRSGAVWCYVPATHKTEHHGRERRIFIGPRAQAELRPFLLRAADAYCFNPRESARAEIAGCRKPKTQRQRAQRPRPRRRGERYTKDSYRRAIVRACVRAGVPEWSPNQLRHSRGTEIRKAFGLEAAQVVLGHAKAQVSEIYAERGFQVARRIMGEVG